MKFKTLIAAAAIAGMSTTAFAQNVTTTTGDVVMIEKNQVLGLGFGLGGVGVGTVAFGTVVLTAGLAAAGVVGGSR